MNPKTFGSALTAFIIVCGGSIVVVAGSGYAINKNCIVLAIALGAISAAKDWRSTNALPPVTEENLQSMLAAYNVKVGSPVGTAVPPVEPVEPAAK